jgi:hypothetical protein
MKFLIALVLFVSSSAFAQNSPDSRLICSFKNGYFKVVDGAQKYEKYIGGSVATVECGRDFGVLIAGPNFVTYFQGDFNERYVGGIGSRAFMLRGRLAVAIMSSYLVVAKAGGQIIEKFISGNSIPTLKLSSSIAVIANAPYLLFTDGNNIVEKYIGNMNYLQLVVGPDIGGALAGNSLIVYNKGSVSEKYIGNRSGNEALIAGRSPVLAVSIGNYFVIYDATRSGFRDQYVGSAGRVEVREDGAYIVLPNGKITRYNLTFGQFESL